MDLSPTRTETVISDVKAWLAGKFGSDATQTGTLDITNGGFGFTTAGGTVPEGTPVKYHAASKKYRRVVTTGGSEEKADGHVWNDVKVKPGTTEVGFALFWIGGPVVDAQVPGTFVDANRCPLIRYV